MERLEQKIVMAMWCAFFVGMMPVLLWFAPPPEWDFSKMNYLHMVRDAFFGIVAYFVLNAAAEKIARNALEDFNVSPRYESQ